MADRWFYSRGEGKVGPCSARQLKDLAASGGILPTDTVWKEGVEKGTAAARVQHLFAPGPPAPPAPAAPAALDPAPAPEAEILPPMAGVRLVPEKPAAAAPAAAGQEPPPQPKARKGRAVAGRGAVLVGQDGVNVRYKKKCTVCSHTESFSHSTPISNGTMRAGYFCPKCRKNRQVEIKGSLS